jgi:hypothetical protein
VSKDKDMHSISKLPIHLAEVVLEVKDIPYISMAFSRILIPFMPSLREGFFLALPLTQWPWGKLSWVGAPTLRKP